MQMTMSEELDKLKALQDVLAKKYEIENEVEDLPKNIEVESAGLERSKKEFIEKNAEYEAEKAKVAALKAELDDAEKAREAAEKGMDSISTHREYEVLEKQIDEAKVKEESIRKDLQKEEKVLSELKDKITEEEEVISITESSLNEKKAVNAQKIDSFKAELDSLSTQEKEMSEGIDPEIIMKFQRIIRRNSKGIVAVKGTVCDGCHMILPAQFANEVHRGDKILFCPYCSRILYYVDDVDNTSTYLPGDDVGSLLDSDGDADESFDDEEDLNDDEFNDSRDENDSDDSDSGSDRSYDSSDFN